MKNRGTRVAGVLALLGLAALCSVAFAAPRIFPTITDAAYFTECGTCHMAYPPQLMPARSWQRVMGSLDSHFGDSARLDGATQAKIGDYLAKNAADKADNYESMSVMASIHGSDTPERITKVPYIEGLHAAVLDPVWQGNPRPKTLAQCSVCHYRAEQGDFFERRFKVSDEAFRKGN
jgi:Dihaem cytochrome c